MSETEKLIQEIIRLSGLDASEAATFSDEELKDAIVDAICESSQGPTFTQEELDEAGCEVEAKDLPELPEEPTIESDFKGGEEAAKCKDKVDVLNEQLKKELREYTDLTILLERLIEFKDNYDVMEVYYSERSKTMAFLLNRYQTMLIHIRNLRAEITTLDTKLVWRRGQLAEMNGISSDVPSKIALTATLKRLQWLKNKKVEEWLETDKAKIALAVREPIINDANNIQLRDSIRYLKGDDRGGNRFINGIRSILNSNGFSNIKKSLDDYSEYMSTKRTNTPVTNTKISKVIGKPLIEFKLNFPNLNVMNLDDDIYNKDTGARSITTRIFKIKNNAFLKTNDYFQSLDGFKIKNTVVTEIRPTSDALYGRYYYKLSDPLERMFTPADKGLTTSASAVDPKLVGSGIETKREGTTDYYINDIEKMQRFYKDFEIIFENKKEQLREDIIVPAFNTVAANMKKLGELEIRILLSAGNVTMDIIDESSDLKLVVDSIERQQSIFLSRTGQLNDEIERVRLRIEELKPTPENVKERLIELDAKCFTDKSQPEPADCTGKEKLGIDPFYDSTLGGTDPTLPDPTRLCYWKEFTNIINKMGLLPVPDTPVQFRYWPVGIVIPSPVPVKIPLPIVWIPVISVSSPFGIIVTFITINGLFISPVVFFMSSSGFKQHIITVKGSSKKFGYETGEEVKDTISIPLALIAAKDKIFNAGKDSVALDTPEKKAEHNTKRENLLIKLNEAKSEGKTKRAKRIQDKIDDLDNATENTSPIEKLSAILDSGESLDAVMKDTEDSIIERIDNLNIPEMKGINALKDVQERRKDKLNKKLDLALENNDIEEANKLRKKLKSDGLSMEEKKKAIKDDILEFFDKIKLPKTQIPKDKGKVDPKISPLESLKSRIKEQLSDFKFDAIPPKNRNVRTILMQNISDVRDDIDLSDFEVDTIRERRKEKLNKELTLAIENNDSEKADKIRNKLKSDGALNVVLNTGKIKDAFKKMNDNLFDKAMGKDNGDDVNILQSERDKKQEALNVESDKDKKKTLRGEIKKLDRKMSSARESKVTRESYAVDASVISSLSGFKIDYDPFRPCCASETVSVELGSLPTGIVGAFTGAKAVVNGFIDGLSDETVVNLFGDATFISPEAIKDAFFNIIISIVPRDITMPVELTLATFATMWVGVLGTLTEPKDKIDVQSASSVPKQITIDMNIIKPAIRASLSSTMDTFISALSIDIENNFTSINGNVIAESLKTFVREVMDSVKSVVSPVYNVINIAKSAKGSNLNIIEGAQHDILPYGAPNKIAFNAITLKKMLTPASANIKIADLSALTAALPFIQNVIRPVFDNPIPHIVVSGAVIAKQQDNMRLLHPIMNSDDIPPWERLSIKNFLLLLFVDEFISEAAEKLGFFRQYL